MKTDIAKILVILDMVGEFKPIVTKSIKILKSYGPEVKELMTDMVMATVDMKIAIIKKYKAEGFTKQEAIDLCMDQWYQIAKAARNIKPNNQPNQLQSKQ